MPAAEKVFRRLAKHYPAETVQWARTLKWSKERVPLDAIHMQPRPGMPRNPVKVAAIRRAIRAGETMKPVVLVRTRKGSAKIADGYHRLEAAKLEGQTGHVAVVARTSKRTGPWSRAMHDAKLNT